MSNDDKFIRDTPHGKLMQGETKYQCLKCKYYPYYDCEKHTELICLNNDKYYFEKEQTNNETDSE